VLEIPKGARYLLEFYFEPWDNRARATIEVNGNLLALAKLKPDMVGSRVKPTAVLEAGDIVGVMNHGSYEIRIPYMIFKECRKKRCRGLELNI
jgi:hypothetical protein